MARPDLSARSSGRGILGLCGLASLAGLPDPAQAGCLDATAAEAGAQHSRWDEIGAQGQRLVRERGTLAVAAIEVAARCVPGEWSLRFEHGQGTRHYVGQSTAGTPIQSTSHLSEDRARLQGWWPLPAGFSLGARAELGQVRREIESVGRIAGYPERFRHGQLAIGLRHDAVPAPGLQLALSGWLGGGPRGEVELQLPGTDPMTLPLGANRLAGASVRLASRVAPPVAGWRWSGGLDCQWQRFGAGAVRAVTRQGVPVGGAAQPETRTAACTAAWQLAYRFD